MSKCFTPTVRKAFSTAFMQAGSDPVEPASPTPLTPSGLFGDGTTTLNNPIEVYTSDYMFGGRPTTRYEIFTRRPHAYRTFFRAVVYVDKESKLPVRYEAYDQPRAGGAPTGDLMEVYSYTDIRPNVGLGESVFTR